MRSKPSPGDDFLNGLDLQRLLDDMESDLESEYDGVIEALVEAEKESCQARDSHFDEEDFRSNQITFKEWLEENDSSEADEYRDLKAFINEIESYSGESLRNTTVVHEGSFAGQAKDSICEQHNIEIGSWVYDHLDWESAIDDYESGYTEIEWDGYKYYVEN